MDFYRIFLNRKLIKLTSNIGGSDIPLGYQSISKMRFNLKTQNDLIHTHRTSR